MEGLGNVYYTWRAHAREIGGGEAYLSLKRYEGRARERQMHPERSIWRGGGLTSVCLTCRGRCHL